MKSRDGKSKRREEKRREKKRREEKKKEDPKKRQSEEEDPNARKGRKVAIHYVFPMVYGSGALKRRVRSHLAR